jgi:hypothetical protein
MNYKLERIWKDTVLIRLRGCAGVGIGLDWSLGRRMALLFLVTHEFTSAGYARALPSRFLPVLALEWCHNQETVILLSLSRHPYVPWYFPATRVAWIQDL